LTFPAGKKVLLGRRGEWITETPQTPGLYILPLKAFFQTFGSDVPEKSWYQEGAVFMLVAPAGSDCRFGNLEADIKGIPLLIQERETGWLVELNASSLYAELLPRAECRDGRTYQLQGAVYPMRGKWTIETAEADHHRRARLASQKIATHGLTRTELQQRLKWTLTLTNAGEYEAYICLWIVAPESDTVYNDLNLEFHDSGPFALVRRFMGCAVQSFSLPSGA
jgi:hypothetical protein